MPLAIAISSTAFAYPHFATLFEAETEFAIIGTINLYLVSTVFSLLVITRSNIWTACGLHGIWSKLNVSRQTISKWEIGDSTPDMEKLITISELFEISLDELVLGKVQTVSTTSPTDTPPVLNVLEEKVLTSDNKNMVKKALKIIGIIAGIILAIDFISMIVYFLLYGVPK